MNGNEVGRPGGQSPERPERKRKSCDAFILRRSDRNSPRDLRRLELVRAMGATS